MDTQAYIQDQLYGKDRMLRPDGYTYKNSGYYGPIALPDGSVMTEYSVGEHLYGYPYVTHMPSIVPGMLPSELAYIGNTGNIMPQSWNKIIDHASNRTAQGLSPFFMKNYDTVAKQDYYNAKLAEIMMGTSK